jgi:hypothetical protein
MATQISKRAFDLTVAHEVTSKAFYEKHYMNPEWPGLQSGPTVGIGYDLGQASRAKIKADWEGLVSPDMLLLMMSCSGATGAAGKVKTSEVRSRITIGWAQALHVFANRDVPTWTAGVLRYIPRAAELPPTCLGVLFDLAYNRGHSWSLSGERYAEMRAIKAHVQAGNFGAVPAEIRSMKRLWPKTTGLLRRCDDRIALWEYGIKHERVNSPTIGTVGQTPTMPDQNVPTNAGPARTKPPATSTAQNTTAAVIVATGGAAAQQSHAMGVAGAGTALAMAAIAALVAGIIWVVWYRNRNPG